MLKGSCLCGRIQYSVEELATQITHCACQTCRKAHGAAFNTVAGVKPESFSWLQGESLLSGYESSQGKVRYFCSCCGSQLIAKKQGAPFWVLRVATLDDDPGMAPSKRIWASHEVPWLAYQADVVCYDQWAD